MPLDHNAELTHLLVLELNSAPDGEDAGGRLLPSCLSHSLGYAKRHGINYLPHQRRMAARQDRCLSPCRIISMRTNSTGLPGEGGGGSW